MLTRPRFLFFPLLLFCACSKDTVDTPEIAAIFREHSYAECDPARLERGLNDSGLDALASFDPRAIFFHSGWRPELPRPGGGKAGVGMVLWKAGGAALAVKVFPGSPADEAGIRAGDVISSVDGKAVSAMPDAVLGSALYGAPGGVFRFAGEKRSGGALNKSLRREFGGAPTVWGFNIPGTRKGYLRIISFSAKTSARIRCEMNDLLDGGASEIIIDLRHNYGGLLEELAASLELFAPGKGPVFRVVSRHPGYSRVYAAPGAGPFAGVKTVLLTDSGTLSRAEIFAAALREWRAAVIMGGASAGDVSVTRSFRLKDGGALRLTVARMLTAAGTDLEGAGLAPDMALDARPPGSQAPIGEFPPPVVSADPLLRRAVSGD